MATKKKEQPDPMEFQELRPERARYHILGVTPTIIYRLSEKAKRELLLPKGRKTAAEKKGTLKHHPVQEFRESPYTIKSNDAPTLLAHIAPVFKKAITGAALDMPGATKTQMERLVWVCGERVPIYGVPRLHMGIVRSADMKKTPDVRTRCIVPKWAAIIEVQWMAPILREPTISRLLSAAGMIQGVGDWRPQRGGQYGQFKLVDQDDPEFLEVCATGGRDVQVKAMNDAVPYDADAEELLAWFAEECDPRGITEVLS